MSETTAPERTKLQKYLDQNLWPMIIIAILVATVASNMAVLTIATQNPPELMTENYYEKGENLKQVLNEKRATAATGWKVSADTPLGDRMLVVLTVVDAAGLPCDSLLGSCELYRPSDKSLDRAAVKLLPMGGGRYAVKHEAPLARGAWECVAELSQGTKLYRDRISLFVD
ncbi:MAG: FixH family protein [Calditrichaeota bacterium]|nr:FixH family protein [Calditrichota bacterium]